MDSIKLSLFAFAVLAFVFQVEWLVLTFAAILLGLIYFDYAPRSRAKQDMRVTAQKNREPIIIQSNSDTTAYDFVTGLVNGVVNDPSSSKEFKERHAALSGKLDKTGAKLSKMSKKLEDIESKLAQKSDDKKN